MDSFLIFMFAFGVAVIGALYLISNRQVRLSQKNLDRQVLETKKITDNQALIIDITRDGNALREREAAALERIAEALEKRS